MIIVTVSRLEFRENAMKISLMKIFGYSLFERHKTLLKMIVVENFVILKKIIVNSISAINELTRMLIPTSVCTDNKE